MSQLLKFFFLFLFSITGRANPKKASESFIYFVINVLSLTIKEKYAFNVNLNNAYAEFTVANHGDTNNLTRVCGFINLPLYSIDPNCKYVTQDRGQIFYPIFEISISNQAKKLANKIIHYYQYPVLLFG